MTFAEAQRPDTKLVVGTELVNLDAIHTAVLLMDHPSGLNDLEVVPQYVAVRIGDVEEGFAGEVFNPPSLNR